jgi:hypothetical protein
MSAHDADQRIQDRGVSREGEAEPSERSRSEAEVDPAAIAALVEEVSALDDEQCGEQVRRLVDVGEEQRVIEHRGP